ncbi:MAG: recombination protein NinG [Candidatus Peribacteraceae bacterium]|nr:recombination protein NinG [Candidatus Peribacteraceae bacterium]
MQKRKPKTIAKLVDEAAVRLQLYVRLKAADSNGYVSCVTCGVTRHYLDGMQGGHFIQRARTQVKLTEENVNPQCNICNGPCGTSAAGNPIAYTKYMQDTYGQEFIDELVLESQKTRKYTKGEVVEFLAWINPLIAELQKEKG